MEVSVEAFERLVSAYCRMRLMNGFVGITRREVRRELERIISRGGYKKVRDYPLMRKEYKVVKLRMHQRAYGVVVQPLTSMM